MKFLTFGPSVKLDDDLTEKFILALLREESLKGFLNLQDVEFYSDLDGEYSGTSFRKTISSIQCYVAFILRFVFNVLYNSTFAMERKPAPYDISLVLKCSFTKRTLQIHFFVDDAIFGLVVGKDFRAVRNLIAAVFPIMAKIGCEQDLRFFPLSKFRDSQDIS